MEFTTRLDLLIRGLTYKEDNIPYLFGGTLAKNHSFDCSAFMQQIFADVGIALPRTSRNQALMGVPIDEEELQLGDLLCFDRNGDGVIDHIGMYVYDGLMLHTAAQPENINLTDWKARYGRYLKTIRRV